MVLVMTSILMHMMAAGSSFGTVQRVHPITTDLGYQVSMPIKQTFLITHVSTPLMVMVGTVADEPQGTHADGFCGTKQLRVLLLLQY